MKQVFVKFSVLPFFYYVSCSLESVYVCLSGAKFRLNVIMLWSEQLSSSDISQFLIAASIWLFTLVKSILLDPLLL